MRRSPPLVSRLLVSILLIACQGARPPAPDEVGAVVLPLSTTVADGTIFRLRDGTFTITGPVTRTLGTEADPTLTRLRIELPVGTYAVALAAGWRLERVVGGVAAPVMATLLGGNPRDVTIMANGTSSTTFRFQVDGVGPIDLTPGQLEIGIAVEQTCNPVTGAGCGPGSKCGARDGGTTCMPAGSVPVGAACTVGAGGDDCAAGGACVGGRCLAVCGLGAPPAGCNCVRFAELFPGHPDVGACVPTCNPLSQDCPGTDACYTSPASEPLCAIAAPPGGTQGEECRFLNSCARGFGCVLPGPAGGGTCAAYCDTTGVGRRCADGPGAAFTCVPIERLGITATAVPQLGICTDCTAPHLAPVCFGL